MGKLDGLGAGVRLLVGVIAGAHQRAGFHVTEAHLQRLFFKEAKLFRRVQARHRQVVFRRPQILADGEDVDFARGQIAKYLQQLSVLSPRPTITPVLVGMTGFISLARSSRRSVRS